MPRHPPCALSSLTSTFAARSRSRFCFAKLAPTLIANVWSNSNRCSNHNLGSSSWRKIIVVISDFPINFCFTFFSLFLYSVLKVLGGLRPPHRRTLRVLPPPAKEINPCCGWLERCLTPLQAKPALVGSNGLEPSTSRLSGVRSNHLSYEPISVAVRCAIRPNLLLRLVSRLAAGGDEQNRTVDPLLARQVLSQLSYAPVFRFVPLG